MRLERLLRSAEDGTIRLLLAAAFAAGLVGASPAAQLTARQCGGSAVFTNTCQGEALFVRLCLGQHGGIGDKAFKVQPGGAATLSVPLNATSVSSCGSPPPKGCPGVNDVPIATCETDVSQALFSEAIVAHYAELNNKTADDPPTRTAGECLAAGFASLPDVEKGKLLAAANLPTWPERDEAVELWYRDMYERFPQTETAQSGCS